MRNSRNRQASAERAPRGSYRSKAQEWQELIENVREILNVARMIYVRQDGLMEGLKIINAKENLQMSKYSEMIDRLKHQRTRIDGLRALVKSLADTPNDTEWQKLNDEILANTAEVEAAIAEGTAPEAETGGPVPSTASMEP